MSLETKTQKNAETVSAFQRQDAVRLAINVKYIAVCSFSHLRHAQYVCIISLASREKQSFRGKEHPKTSS